MPVVKMDEKGRIQLPQEVREAWQLKPKQPLVIELKENAIAVRPAGKLDPKMDSLLRDILLHPGRSKVKITRELLNKLKDEMWMP